MYKFPITTNGILLFTLLNHSDITIKGFVWSQK